jgi:ubiquinone/menaquinone biosynthesis C-methylase UbiE
VEPLGLAETFHRTAEWDYSCGTALLRSLNITPGMRVLELGSATGRLAIDAAHLVAPDGEIIALEPSESRLQVAQRIYRAGNVSFRLGGPKELAGFNEATFDMAYSNLLLHRLEDPVGALQAVFRVLRPGGSLAFTCPLAPPKVVETLEMLIFSHPDFASFQEGSSGLAAWTLQPVEHWVELVKQTGFRGVSYHPVFSELNLASPGELVAYWEAATEGCFLKGLSEPERESVVRHVEAQFSTLWGGAPLKGPTEVVAFQAARAL